MSIARALALTSLLATPVLGQAPDDPFPQPIEATRDVITVNFVEFATIPDADGQAPRLMHLVTEPGTRRIFTIDMRGPLYSISYDGKTVRRYLDVNDPRWGVQVQFTGRERGVQSFAFHPQFGQPGTPGYGKLYTWSDSRNQAPTPDFAPLSDDDSHDTVLMEWTARDPSAATYDGGPPRELFRFQQPFSNHNGGMIGFNPLASSGDPDFGMLYVGIADGGSGGDPMNMAQNLGRGFGKIFRIDPLGRNSRNGKYGIPADNPFADDGRDDTLGEIWAYGVRNPQRFTWDRATGRMFFTDIGQDVVEKVSLVTRGANLGWNVWEGSYKTATRRTVDPGRVRGDPSVTYPIAEYGQLDPLLQRQSAASGVFVYRGGAIPQLENLLLFGDNPSGEIFYVSADNLPSGGQAPIRRILLNQGGAPRTFLQVIQAKNREQGKDPAGRADMRMGAGPDGQVLLINKGDGVIRLLVP